MTDGTGYADRAWAKKFYSSRAWKDCRKAVFTARHGLCERCLKRGLIVPGTQVHHIIPISPENIENPYITLNPDNLVLLCKQCHDAQHRAGRYLIGEEGELIIK